jgi:hypothetical protein
MICKVFFELDDQLIIDDILNIRNVSFKETYNKDIIDTWEEYDKKSYHFTIYDNDLLSGDYRLRRFDNNFNDTWAYP